MAMRGLDSIAKKEYLGRLIIMGRVGDNDVLMYAITGRSKPSKAREFVIDGDTIRTSVTDKGQLEKGNPQLLIYNCIRRYHDNLIVSNGAQTDLIYNTLESLTRMYMRASPAGILMASFDRPYLVEGNTKEELIDLTTYEPDAPNYTPRISGIFTAHGAAMSIVKYDCGQAVKQFFEVPRSNRDAKAISTYSGKNVPAGQSIPQFSGEPFHVVLWCDTPKEASLALWDALGPKNAGAGAGGTADNASGNAAGNVAGDADGPDKDYRVGVATLFYNRKSNRVSTCIINNSINNVSGNGIGVVKCNAAGNDPDNAAGDTICEGVGPA